RAFACLPRVRRRLAMLARAAPRRQLAGEGTADPLVADREHRVEDANPRRRPFVANHRRRPGLRDDVPAQGTGSGAALPGPPGWPGAVAARSNALAAGA